MKKITFICYGHKNILGTHRNTLEFTHDKNLTLRGDCIIGVQANYKFDDFKHLKPLQEQKIKNRIKIIIEVDDLKDEVIAEYHPGFHHEHEMVIRTSTFADKRTFAIEANKAAIDLRRDLIRKMKNPWQEMKVTITEI